MHPTSLACKMAETAFSVDFHAVQASDFALHLVGCFGLVSHVVGCFGQVAASAIHCIAMPPKKRVAKQADGVADALGASSAAVSDVVAPHLARVHQAIATICDHVFFKDLAMEKPLDVKSGGHQSPFKQEDCTAVLKRGEDATYVAGCNFFWQDLTWMANHRMPINNAQVTQIKKAQLKPEDPPNRFPFVITVALDDASMKVQDHLGALKRVSQPEPAHALLFAVEEAITSKQPDAVLQRWKTVLLTTEFAFQVVPEGGDQRYWKYEELRQRAIEQGDNAKVTTRQWVYDIVGFKFDKQAETKKEMGAHAIHQAYKSSVKFWARTSEDISVSFVDSAITVYPRVFSLPATRVAVIWCDENLSSTENPFQSIYLLQAVVDRAKTPDKISWAIQGLVDHLRMGIIDKSVFSIKGLRDHRIAMPSSLHCMSWIK